jgi:hypothetical protein
MGVPLLTRRSLPHIVTVLSINLEIIMIEIKVGIESNSSPRELDRVGRGLIAFAQAMRDRAQPDPAPEPGVGVAPEPDLMATVKAPLAAGAAEPDAAPAPEPETGPGVAPAPTGVELDSDGLPWDARIHSSSRQLLAKTQQWKRKRGVQPVLVTRVVEELRQALGVPAPVVEAAPAPVVEAAPAPVVEPAPATGAGGAIQTLSELNTAVLAAGLDLAAVMPVVQEAGLASYALLGVRPDLIPAIARKLGLGG